MIVALLAAANTIGALPIYWFFYTLKQSDPAMAAEYANNPHNPTLLGLDPVAGIAVILFQFLILFVTFALLVKPVHERSLSQTVSGGYSFRWGRCLTGSIVWAIISAVYLAVYLGFEPGNFRINNTSSSLLPLVIVSFVLIPFQAGTEEVLFRGYLFQGFYRLLPRKWFPLITTSVLFGLLHSFNPEVKDFGFLTMMPHYILFGLVFGITTILDDGAEIAIGAHTANNIFLSIMLTHKSSALQTPAVYEQINVYPWTEFAGLVVLSILFLAVLGRKYRWNPRFLI